jgi:2-polyprenyl-3-methyl-5-hydroxy-6-metoxy-1,4-benzoquinol methylase
MKKLLKEKTFLLKNDYTRIRKSQIFKEYLLDSQNYNTFITEVVGLLENSTSLHEISRYLSILLEVDVRDVIRIGESTLDSLIFDLKTKATGEFEFVEGDRNLAIALLSIIEDTKYRGIIQQLLEHQIQYGIATPFDYRRLLSDSKWELKKLSVTEIISFLKKLFENNKLEYLLQLVEVGFTFGSTKIKRYTDEEEKFLEKYILNAPNILDIGGSTGISTNYLMQRFNIPIGTVSDVRTERNFETLKYSKFSKYPNIDYVLGEKGNIVKCRPNHRKYKVITVNNVLVHVVDIEKAIINIINSLDEDAILIIQDGYNSNPPRKEFRVLKWKKGEITQLNN